MFGELPKLFDRDFAIAFFLPSAAFTLGNASLLAGFGLSPSIVPLFKGGSLQGLTTLGLISWVGGVLLLVLNYSIYRLLEGYGEYNPAKYFASVERRRYEKLQSEIARVESEIIEGENSGEDEEVLAKLDERRADLIQRAADRFPIAPDRIFHTAFGNTLRAFEDYPTEMYRVDSIYVWARLQGVVPADYRGMVNAAKAQTDFWVNLRLLSTLLVVEYLGLLIYTRQVRLSWVAVFAAVVSWVAAREAQKAARGWGDYVKGAFDLYLPDLRKQLQLPPPADIEEEREMWDKFSRQVVFHRPEDVASRVIEKCDDDEKTVREESKAASG